MKNRLLTETCKLVSSHDCLSGFLMPDAKARFNVPPRLRRYVNSPPRRIRGWFHLRASPRAGRLQRGKNGLGGPPVVFWSPSLPRGAS